GCLTVSSLVSRDSETPPLDNRPQPAAAKPAPLPPSCPEKTAIRNAVDADPGAAQLRHRVPLRLGCLRLSSTARPLGPTGAANESKIDPSLAGRCHRVPRQRIGAGRTVHPGDCLARATGAPVRGQPECRPVRPAVDRCAARSSTDAGIDQAGAAAATVD